MGNPALKNWKKSEVERFLKNHGFVLDRIDGSHFYYINPTNKRSTCVSKRRDTYGRHEMINFVDQSGIPEEEWTKKKKKG